MPTDTLYETNFVLWTGRQAQALRELAEKGSNLPLDFENLAEEIESVGNEVRHKIESLTRQVMVHLLKLACSSAAGPRNKWKAEIDEFRIQLERHLRDNHAIRARYDGIVAGETGRALTLARRSFLRYEEPEAMRKLEPWRRRGLSASEVLADGLYPVLDTTTMAREDS